MSDARVGHRQRLEQVEGRDAVRHISGCGVEDEVQEDRYEKPRGGETLFEDPVFANLSYLVGN